MTSQRKVTFINDYFYHVYNRGVEKRPLFTSKREYTRFIQTVDYYRHIKPSVRFSKFITMNVAERLQQQQMLSSFPTHVDILAFCLMPNHFHFLLRQKSEHGISTFLSHLSNSYAKYFNTRNKRVGPLYQGAFKATFIETDEEVVHVSRYIHINPAVASLISPENLLSYQWSSLPDYFDTKDSSFIETQTVLGLFPQPEAYKQFVFDQIDYAKNLEKIKHIAFEE